MRDSACDRRRAFTLVELMVVIGILALLMGILLPTLGQVRRRATVVRCAANLHDIGLAMLNYAAVSGGRWPQFVTSAPAVAAPPGGYWLWDLECPTRDALVRLGATQANLYCPAVAPDQHLDSLWHYGETRTANGLSYTGLGYCVVGYYFLTYRPDGTYPNISPPGTAVAHPSPGTVKDPWNDPLGDTTGFVSPYRNWRYQKTLRPDLRGCVDPPFHASGSAAEVELAADATADDGAGHFDRTIGNVFSPTAANHWFGRTVNGGFPIGGNVLFMDGHVVDRRFDPKVLGLGAGPADTTGRDVMHARGNPRVGRQVRFFF